MRGLAAQITALADQQLSTRQELDSLKLLLERGIVTRTRLLQLERSLTAIQEQLGEARSNLARAEQALGEQQQIEIQIRHQKATAIAQELRDVELRLAEILPKLASAEAVLDRMVIRAPYQGTVIGLNIFAVGAVIGKGERLLEIVPSADALVIEASIAVKDVADVHVGSVAEVHPTAFKAHTTPALHAVVDYVSADRLTDDRTGTPYYLVRLKVLDDGPARTKPVALKPGMAASVTIPTVERTVFQYLMDPISASLNAAWRER